MPGIERQDIVDVRISAQRQVLDFVEASRATDSVAPAYVDDTAPDLERTIRLAHSLGLVVELTFTEREPTQNPSVE